MDRDLQISLIYRSLKGELSDQEQQQLDAWLEQDADHQRLRDRLQQEWELSEGYEPHIEIDTKADFQKLSARIQEHDKAAVAGEKSSSEGRIISINRRWLSIAAGLLLVFSLAWWLWPGGVDPVEMSTAITGAGEERELILADGSTVWLNENSKLTFPNQFPAGGREVQLEGEAFFSVKKNAEAPFKIRTTTAAEIEVLGTSFLVQAPMAAEQVLVEVASGTVRLQSNSTDQQVVLNAGERGTWSAEGNKVQKSETANPNSYAWQTDVLVFDETSLAEVAKDLEQYFKVSIKVQRNLGSSCVVSGRFPEPNLDEVIVAITRSLGIEWSTAGADRYRISGNGCN